MRSALLLAAGCIVCLAQAGLATTYGEPIYYIRLAKPNAGYTTFMFDRNDCIQSTSHKVREHYVDLKGERFFGVNLQYHTPEFIECMKARGYALDNNGYRAIGYQVDSEGILWGVPMDQWR